jgi:hypothetical protein
MGSLDFAVSIHSLVTSVGNYAGLAAIVGLAILILLYFAQARESATLRDRADEAEQRVGELEARLGQLARGQAAPAPQTATPQTAGPAAAPAARPRPATGAPGPTKAPVPAGATAASFPWAPAGVGAPALTAATTLIPVWQPAAGSPPSPAGPAAPNGQPAEVTEIRTDEPVREPAVVGASAAAAATAANGVSRARVATPVGAPAAGSPRPPARPGGSPPRPVGPGVRPTNGPARAGTGAPRFLPPQPEPPRRSRTGRVIAVVIGIAALVAAIAVVLVVTKAVGGKTSSNTPRNAAGSSNGQAHAVVFNPRSITVAVLNGTGTPGLAGRTSKRLIADGYKPGTVATASDQTQPTTTVAYLPGYRPDALHVASVLKLPATSVHQVSSSAQAVACPPPSACSANVIVTVGADLATS